MQILPDKGLVNIPNIALIIFSASIAFILIHLAHKPFENE